MSPYVAAGVAGLAGFALGEVAVRVADRDVARAVSGSSAGCDVCGIDDAAAWSTSIVGHVRARKHGCCGAPLARRGIVGHVSLVAITVSLAFWAQAKEWTPRATGAAAAMLVGATALVIGFVANAELMTYSRRNLVPAALAGLVGAWLAGVPILAALMGAATGGGLGLLTYRVRKGGLGPGDVEVWTAAGVLVGGYGVLAFCAASSFVGVAAYGWRALFRVEVPLPASVRKEREELQKAADAGDAEAAEMLREDALGGGDAFATGPLYAVGLAAVFVARDLFDVDWLQIPASFGFARFH